ncbi:GNAT family N-acetyltransferase [Nonomuraea sp. NPDC050663]|uniref:GNAT family N-acetyltransferase n=1 Tax=Nonomuraea sp. NPDC050663 TaxID=3364370 RepID=UPI0037B59BCC
MSENAWRLRAYRGPQDLPGIGAVREAMRAVEEQAWFPGPDGPQVTERHLAACLVAEAGGEIVGYSWTDWWTEDDGTRLFLLLGWVTPEWRRRGIGTAILRRQEADAVRLAEGEGVLGGNADDTQPGTAALLLAHGYAVVFTQLEMACEPRSRPLRLPDGLELRPVLHGHHPAIHAAIAECFRRGGLGYIDHTWDDYLAELAGPLRDLGLWCVAWDGDQVAGLALTEVRGDGCADTLWVAVREPWRRRGLATALMGETLSRLAARGAGRALLSTGLDNPHDSVALYEGVGYRVVRRMPRYRKPM